MAGVAAPPPDGIGDIPISLTVIPLTASAMVLLLEVIDTPSRTYSAFCGVARTELPVCRPDVPTMVSSEPTPVVVEVNTIREPPASVRMLALKPRLAYCELIESRTCCNVAPAGTLTSNVLLPCLMLSVVGEAPVLTTEDAPSVKTLVEIFDAVANLVTSSEKLPAAAPLPVVTVATFSSDDEPVSPLKLEAVFMLSNAPRKASSAAWILPMDDSEVVAFSVWLLICVCFGALSESTKDFTIAWVSMFEPIPLTDVPAIISLLFQWLPRS
ncbi:hypothetical protein D3C85_781990 [compost metagenome]